MCGIIGVTAERDVSKILLEGLKRLEYRGYDSAGVALVDYEGKLQRRRALGKVNHLSTKLEQQPLQGKTGIAHTRWATHGEPSETNAHPHLSGNIVGVVHNGIIENHEALKEELTAAGYVFETQTDTEVIAHLLHQRLMAGDNLLTAVNHTASRLEGSYAIVAIAQTEPDILVGLRQGNPLVLGLGIGEHLIASDSLALLPVTQTFVYLEDGDRVVLSKDQFTIYNANGEIVTRPQHHSDLSAEMTQRGHYRHFMQKEIAEQANAIQTTLEGRLSEQGIIPTLFGPETTQCLKDIRHVQIVACGTSYHAGLVAKYWLEEFAEISCQVEVASEFRYRKKVVMPNTLFIAISQSGETADTLAALRQAKQLNYHARLAICNVPDSALVREADFSFMTRAGREIGVASTKAFTTQLTALLLLTLALMSHRHPSDKASQYQLSQALKTLPDLVKTVLNLDKSIEALSHSFLYKQHSLFVGRGELFPVALEGALKLKEISYIHAEAYPAGELKHGPLALVDKHMPVIALAPHNNLSDKLQSNIAEIAARGGELFIFTDQPNAYAHLSHSHLISLPPVPSILQPIVYTIPLQLLAYHVALIKGTDVDQPRNLAKSVTVE